jgi:glycopeptide antibiotics resistance protein
MKKWLYFISSILFVLFVHYYIVSVLLDLVGMTNTLLQVIVACIEVVFVYDAIMFFTKNWTVGHRVLLFFVYYLFLIIALLVRYDQGVSMIQLNPLACIREVYYGSWIERLIMLFNVGYFMFMPWVNGLFVCKDKENFILSVCVGFGCEFLQLIFHRGVFDVGDITLYVLGVLLGLYIKRIYHEKKGMMTSL